MKKTYFSHILAIILPCVFALSAIETRAQEATPAPTLKQVMVDQVFLDDATKAFTEVVSLRVANEEAKTAIKKHKEANVELMAIIKDYAMLDTPKKKKGFWSKVGSKLTKLLDEATDPETIRTVATLIILSKAASQ